MRLSPAAALGLLLGAPVPALAGDGSTFVGHYGTQVQFPAGLRATNVSFAPQGDELIMLAKGEDPYFLRICSKAARPGADARGIEAEMRADAKRRGLKFEPVSLGKGFLGFHVPQADSFQIVKDSPEYVYHAGGADKDVVLSIFKGIQQPPLKDWLRQVGELKRKSGNAFSPELKPGPVYLSPRGYAVGLPKGYTYFAESGDVEETVYLFPIRHAPLLHMGILRDVREYPNFEVAQLQFAPEAKVPARDRLRQFADYYRRNKNLTEADFKWSRDANGREVMDRLKPAFLRHLAWNQDGLFILAVSSEEKLLEAATAKISTRKRR
jgi:hypothetical protein